MDNQKRIGLIGTGLMGTAMARRFLDCGHPVLVYNRSLEKTAPLQQAGATVAASPNQVLEQTDVTLSMLRDYEASRQILLTDRMDWKNRSLVMMSTIDVAESQFLSRSVEERGGRYLEAPVLGSIPQTLTGTLLIMAAGNRPLFDALLPILKVLGRDDTVFVGPAGSAAAMKLAFNQLIASLTTAFAASHAFLKKEKVSLELFMDLLRKSALYAPTFDKKRLMMEKRQYDSANFSLSNMLKDMGLIERAFSRQGLANDALKGVQAIMERAMGKHLEQADYASLYEAVWGRQ